MATGPISLEMAEPVWYICPDSNLIIFFYGFIDPVYKALNDK
jgi:hypothetical protein